MHLLRGSRARTLLLALALALGACAGESAPVETFDPGISGATLDGALEVIVVDEATRTPIPATVEVVHAGGALPPVSGDGRFTFTDDALAGSISIHVTGVDRPQAFVGVTGSRVVIPIARPEVRTIEGTVRGAEALGASDVVVGALVAPSFVRTDTLEHAAPSPCATDADGCRFRIDDAPVTSDTLVATLRDSSGAVVAFGIGTIDERATALALDDPSSRAPVVDVTIASPPTPPVELAAVVGVPGLATPSGVAFLVQTPSSEGTIGVPALTGSIADASWWLLAEAAPSFADRTTRSVIVQRGLRDPADVGAWPAWLELPELAPVDPPRLSPAPGATMHVIDWLAPNAAVLASALILDPTAPITFDPPVTAAAVRVRAIDAPGASPSALDLAEAERVAIRFSESTIAL